MSFIKRLDDISGTKTRSKTINEAITKIEEVVANNKSRNETKKSNKDNELKKETEEA